MFREEKIQSSDGSKLSLGAYFALWWDLREKPEFLFKVILLR